MSVQIRQQIEARLQDQTKSILEIYFDIQCLCEQQFGEHIIILIEIGSFFEVYGVDTGTEQLGKPKEVAEILNLQLTRRNKTIPENSLQNPLMAGFPTAAFDRYISRLVQEQKYTIVLIRQRGTPPAITRYVDRILSPGVNFDYALDHDDNFITSVVVDRNQAIYSVGYAAVDVTTGKTVVLEVHGTQDDPTLALDELSQAIQTYHTTELVFTHIHSSITVNEIIEYIEQPTIQFQTNTKRFAVQYQNELFQQVYDIQSMLSPIEYLDLERQPLTSEALGVLLDWVITHDDQVVQNLSLPIKLDSTQLLYLGNEPLKQLNIISQDPADTTILRWLDHTTTSLGKRLLRDRLFHPVTNAILLQERYALAIAVQPLQTELKRDLQNVYDLERLLRRIQLGRLHPFEVNFLYDSLQAVQQSMAQLQTQPELQTRLQSLFDEVNNVQQCLTHIERIFNLDQSTQFARVQLTTSIFQAGFNVQLDQLLQQQTTLDAKLEIIRKKLLSLLEQATGTVQEDFVQIKQLDKEGHHLTITKSRYAQIQQSFQETMISIDGTVYACSDFTVRVQTSNVKITAKIIDELSEQIVNVQTKIAALVKELFCEQLNVLSNQFGELLQRLSQHIAQIDVAVSTIQTAQQFHLVQPEIVAVRGDETILEFTELRHPLVEAREDNGIYVPNDIALGSQLDQFGLLLYGINSSGKSSLIKSVGICIVLAQAGFFVPANTMRFSIVQELFTRIMAHDNFERGLSSFAVELLELKNIFNRCSAHSVILGDEISHGTETLSAIALVSATILQLVQAKAIFMLATHLHQLIAVPEITELTTIAIQHLAVHYDANQDKLMFERTLQTGSGDSIYGLEFAKSLHLAPKFLQQAMKLRKALNNDLSAVELVTKQQHSKYNPNVLLTNCAVCGDFVEDTHHIREQHLADQTEHIGHIPKDHKFNLVPLCKACHNKVHSKKLKIHGFVMTSNGLELQYEEAKK